ncbi:MAG: hypothetical protein DYG96_13920 [Chlorobi bacterium CHB2]|nr:hypothetical protein [Chlorobi bacterium CHB2]
MIPRALPWAMIVCPFRAKEGKASGIFGWSRVQLHALAPCVAPPLGRGEGGGFGEAREPRLFPNLRIRQGGVVAPTSVGIDKRSLAFGA